MHVHAVIIGGINKLGRVVDVKIFIWADTEIIQDKNIMGVPALLCMCPSAPLIVAFYPRYQSSKCSELHSLPHSLCYHSVVSYHFSMEMVNYN